MGLLPLFNQWFIWLFALTTWSICVNGDSYSSNSLRYLEFISKPSIEILPRNRFETHNQGNIISFEYLDGESLRHDDSIRIRFIAFNKTFNLHLEPHSNLLHPEATITIHHANKTSTTTQLLPEDHRLYKGYLLDVEFTDKRLTEDIIGLKRKSIAEELFNSAGVLGWASIHILEDGSQLNKPPTFEGAFSYNNDIYHIKTIENYKLTQTRDDPSIPNYSARHIHHKDSTMVIFRDSDLKSSKLERRSLSDENAPSCGSDDIFGIKTIRRNPNNHFLTESSRRQISPWWKNLDFGSSLNIRGLDVLYNRDSDNNTSNNNVLFKRAPSSCPTARKIAFMGAAADCTYVSSYKSSDGARKQILTDWSTASAVYERTFNVTLGLIKIELHDPQCPTTPDPNTPWNIDCSDSYSINSRLSDFSLWRGKLDDKDAALWHLMSKCATGTKVGVAWLGQLCVTTSAIQNTDQGQAYVSGTGVSTIVKDEWKVVAHEVGHGFGAYHDCTVTTCPCSNPQSQCGCCPLSSTVCDAGGKYIMNPTSNVLTNDFSPCSISDICSLAGTATCLKDPSDPKSKLILSQGMCGNGLKENNEQCDCGTDCANDPCCDGPTCKLKSGAVCSDQNDMCCQNCTYKASGSVCRPQQDVNCDIAEVCNGTSGDCPPDTHVNDGTSCGTNLQCAGGQCTSRDKQCGDRGSRMGITKACPLTIDSSCVLSCANPNDTNSCLEMSGYFVDGTPCGFGGTCNNGQCDKGSPVQAALSWIKQNPKIAIPVGIVLGIMILLCLCNCIFRCFRRRQIRPERDSSDHNSGYGYSSVSGPTHSAANLRGSDNNNNNINNDNDVGNRAAYSNIYTPKGWVDPTPYNGPISHPASSQPRERMPTPNPNVYYPNNNRSTDRLYASSSSSLLSPPSSSSQPIYPPPQMYGHHSGAGVGGARSYYGNTNNNPENHMRSYQQTRQEANRSPIFSATTTPPSRNTNNMMSYQQTRQEANRPPIFSATTTPPDRNRDGQNPPPPYG